MIYSNQNLKSTEQTFDFGVIHQICMGELGRGRRLISLTCPAETTINQGMNPDYTIGITKSGKPRVNKFRDKNLYLLLSSEGGYTRRGNGTIQVLEKQKDKFQVMARGNGADGDAGRIGQWDCLLLKAPNTDAIVRVKPSGSDQSSILYLIHSNMVYSCQLQFLEDCCDSLRIDIPCEIISNEGKLSFGNDWITL